MKRRDFLRYGAMGMVAASSSSVFGPHRSRAISSSESIVRCVIHPAIGVARVGNSPDQYFLGPEVPGPHPLPDGGFKDQAGRLKRQAARFRVYGLDADGRVVRELTAADAEITWRVHLANSKAAWFNFETAFDIPEATGQPVMPDSPPGTPLVVPRRNAAVTGADRAALTIDPGERAIAGANTNGDGADSRYACDTGRFFNTPVYLGEVRTDAAGRLLVLGGRGDSAPVMAGARASTFANNDGWHDDTADGPVDATVRIGGRELEAEGAWVVVAPPNYAPGIQSIVTMYDLMFEVATRLEPERAPRRPSFTRQIYPLLARHVDHQWVNAGFLRDFGWGAPGNFLAPDTFALLANASESSRTLRTQVFQQFRDPAYLRQDYDNLPPYYGDGIALPPISPRQWMAVLSIQYGWLQQWANGDFDDDWPEGGLQFPSRLEDLPIDEQPAALDRAVLDECLGGPFHPGCEMTWPMRVASMYESPFRLRRRQGAEPDWGAHMTSAIALAPNGPLSGSGPGDITRWMAVPWQTDTSSCRSNYVPGVDLYLPTFWPARVPNHILTTANYRIVLDQGAGMAARETAFRDRTEWLRSSTIRGQQAIDLINEFIGEWSRYGVVTQQVGPADAAFPDTFWVETGYEGSTS
ncbi:MAG: LodA/GoxA family CTQ-dependent oxidase [Dehalococcoidia bacterium]